MVTKPLAAPEHAFGGGSCGATGTGPHGSSRACPSREVGPYVTTGARQCGDNWLRLRQVNMRVLSCSSRDRRPGIYGYSVPKVPTQYRHMAAGLVLNSDTIYGWCSSILG
jgi:hypothetical protein